MNHTYRGFGIELSTSTDTPTSQGLWGFEIYAANHEIIYDEVDKYETSGDAWDVATRWIDTYFKWTPMTESAKQAIKLQEILKTLEDQLNQLTEVPYTKYYEKIVMSGLSNLDHILLSAYDSITEAMKINQEVIKAIKAHPAEDLNTAISIHLQRGNND